MVAIIKKTTTNVIYMAINLNLITFYSISAVYIQMHPISMFDTSVSNIPYKQRTRTRMSTNRSILLKDQFFSVLEFDIKVATDPLCVSESTK